MYRLMVADDEMWIRKGVIKMIALEELQISLVYEADSVMKAFEVFKENKPDIVISDVKFPVQDGCTLCEKIYEISPKTRMIMISGYSEFEYVKRALTYKAVDYLLKPIDKTVLNDTIKRCIAEISLCSSDKEKYAEDSNISEQRTDFLEINSEKGIQKDICEAMETIKSDYSTKFTLPEFAAKYYLSEAYFSYAFKKFAGISLMNYIMEVRVDKAKELLLSGDYKVKDIALQVGYTDQHYFTKVFKKLTGLSPIEYKTKIEKDMLEDEPDYKSLTHKD